MKPEEVLIKIKTEITDEKKDINEKMIDDLDEKNIENITKI